MPFLGAHLSAAGGLWRAVEAGSAIGCESLQVFLRSPGRWAMPPLTDTTVEKFRGAARAARLERHCFAHAPYLLNLASGAADLRARSIAVLTEELARAGRLGLAGVVLHPGSAGDDPVPTAEERCREAICEALRRAGKGAARLLLEGTAGAGAQLGRTPVELARLVPAERRGDVGICLDTAHLWGAGYNLVADGWEQLLGELEESWGIAAPDLLHANDTPVPLGSRRDRHAPPGEGALGKAFYRKILRDPRLAAIPVILEIPPGTGSRLVAKAIRRLRRWEAESSNRRAAGC